MKQEKGKWAGFPIYNRPLGKTTEGIDDGRPVVMITDLSVCAPSRLIAGGNSEEHDGAPAAAQWGIVDYTTDKFFGKMLTAHRTSPAPDVTLPLNVEGWYAVYVWIMGGDVDQEGLYPFDFDCVYSQSSGPLLHLTGDEQFSGLFRTLSHDRMMWPGFEACFWRYEDLTDKSITIRHQGSTVHIGAVQLIPLSPAEVEVIKEERSSRTNKRLILKSDEFTGRPKQLSVDQLRHSDVSAWIVGCEETDELFSSEGPQDILALRETMHSIGAEAYVCDRPSLWSSALFHWEDRKPFDFETHPEWHCRDRDGTPTHTASYAVPEVVDYMLERARAVAETGIDGFGYFFNRGPGMVLFEPAAMKGFEEEHGVDPLTLDERDDRLLDWRADIITEFLRKVRSTLDNVAEKRGLNRIKMVHVVLGDEAANRVYSFDVPRWIKEGLVDVLCPYPWTDYQDRWLAQGFVEVDVKYFAGLVKDTDVALYPMWLTGRWRRHWTPEHVQMKDYFTKAMQQYADGADGISAWDFGGLHAAFCADRWLRLGHKDKLAEWIESDFPLPPKVQFRTLGGKRVDRFPEGTGG